MITVVRRRRLRSWTTSCPSCSLAADFELDHAYGAKSGTTYEDRVISAYLHELLQNPDDASREFFFNSA
jgi:hypothetical protein